MASSCDICCEPFNRTTHTSIECMHSECGFRACKACVRSYIISVSAKAHCMSCKKEWPKNYLVEKLNRSFVGNEYAKLKKKRLLEREISKLPDTMELAKLTKEHKVKEMIEREKCKKYAEQIREVSDLMTKLQMRKNNLNALKDKHSRAAKYHKDQVLGPGVTREEDGGDNKTKFIMSCPSNDCRGFLSEQYRCGLCSNYACPKCLEIIGTDKHADHTCNEDNVKTAQLIRKDTKPCPGCGTRISKIDGCDQMWCVECHTAFSWNSGKIDNGRIHNPHFYQHKRNENNGLIPRAPGDVLCGGLCNIAVLQQNIIAKIQSNFNANANTSGPVQRAATAARSEKHNSVYDLHNLVSHITHHSLPTTRASVDDIQHETLLKNARVSYILGDISKESLASQVYVIENKREQNMELLHIYELISVVGIELFADLANCKKRGKEFETYLDDEVNKYRTLCDYSNKQFVNIGNCYNVKVDHISTAEWKIKRVKTHIGPERKRKSKTQNITTI